MKTTDLASILEHLFGELIYGTTSGGPTFVFNPGDDGLLASLERMSAEDASSAPNGGASVAAHAEHLRYGFSLLNSAQPGANPYAEADWTRAWTMGAVSGDEWRSRVEGLRREAEAWLAELGTPREVDTIAMTGIIGSIVHLAYHVGAMRQVDRSLGGPSADAFAG
jgi:hypothetical protein